MWTQNQEIAKWSLLKMLGKKNWQNKSNRKWTRAWIFSKHAFPSKKSNFCLNFFLFWTHSVCIWSFNWKNRKINFFVCLFVFRQLQTLIIDCISDVQIAQRCEFSSLYAERLSIFSVMKTFSLFELLSIFINDQICKKRVQIYETDASDTK